MVALRSLHEDIDRAVLDAYGWHDVPTDCGFLLDYEIDEEHWGPKNKPFRYRWPNEVRDEVLARLLERNARCATTNDRSGRATADTQRETEGQSARTSARKARAPGAVEPRPLLGTSDD